MTDASAQRRKRLFFRCHHTGMKENDLLLGAFARAHLASLTDDEVAWFEDFLMNNNDIDIYEWIVGRTPLPPALDHPVMQRLTAFVGAP